jgi:hypothetical protein
MKIKLLKNYRGHQKGDEIEALDSEIGWLGEFGYISPKPVHTEAKVEPKSPVTRKPRKPKNRS